MEPANDEGKPKNQQPDQELHHSPQWKAKRAMGQDTGTTQKDQEAQDKTKELGGQTKGPLNTTAQGKEPVETGQQAQRMQPNAGKPTTEHLEGPG